MKHTSLWGSYMGIASTSPKTKVVNTFSALLALCAGYSPVTGKFPTQRPVTRSFGVFFDLRLNKRLSKQSWGWWFEMPSRPLWRHCNVSVDMWILLPSLGVNLDIGGLNDKGWYKTAGIYFMFPKKNAHKNVRWLIFHQQNISRQTIFHFVPYPGIYWCPGAKFAPGLP